MIFGIQVTVIVGIMAKVDSTNQAMTHQLGPLFCILNVIGMTGLPNEFDASLLNDNDFIKAMHNLLLDVHVIKGYLICQESSRRFPIDNGIPNMKLPESDV